MKGIDYCLQVLRKAGDGRFRFMLEIRVCRDLFPMKVTIVSAKFHEYYLILGRRAAFKGSDDAFKSLAGRHAKACMIGDYGIRQTRETVHAIILENCVSCSRFVQDYPL